MSARRTVPKCIIRAFIANAETVEIGTKILQARCFATPFMFLSFHMVYLMQALKQGKWSFLLAFIRQAGAEYSVFDRAELPVWHERNRVVPGNRGYLQRYCVIYRVCACL